MDEGLITCFNSWGNFKRGKARRKGDWIFSGIRNDILVDLIYYSDLSSKYLQMIVYTK